MTIIVITIETHIHTNNITASRLVDIIVPVQSEKPGETLQYKHCHSMDDVKYSLTETIILYIANLFLNQM